MYIVFLRSNVVLHTAVMHIRMYIIFCFAAAPSFRSVLTSGCERELVAAPL